MLWSTCIGNFNKVHNRATCTRNTRTRNHVKISKYLLQNYKSQLWNEEQERITSGRESDKVAFYDLGCYWGKMRCHALIIVSIITGTNTDFSSSIGVPFVPAFYSLWQWVVRFKCETISFLKHFFVKLEVIILRSTCIT